MYLELIKFIINMLIGDYPQFSRYNLIYEFPNLPITTDETIHTEESQFVQFSRRQVKSMQVKTQSQLATLPYVALHNAGVARKVISY